jgi:hypothetical protein
MPRGPPWTREEDLLLKKLHSDGMLYKDIAKQIKGRSIPAIWVHARKLGLQLRLNWMKTDYQQTKNRSAWITWVETVPLTNEEAAYIAGIIDGEGTITLCRNTTKTSCRFTPRIVISNSSMILIEWLRNRLKTTSPSVVKRHTWNPNKPVYVISVLSYRVVGIVRRIQQYLVIKEKQAQIILDFWKLREAKDYAGPYGQQEQQLYIDIVSLNMKNKKFQMKPFK